MHSLSRRLDKIETKTARSSRGVNAAEVYDENDRVTGYQFGPGFGRTGESYFYPREDGESLEAFAQRAEARASEPDGDEVLLMVRRFVPAMDGKPAWKNGVGPT